MRSSSAQASISGARRNESLSPSTSIYRGVSTQTNNTRQRPPLHYYSYSHDSNSSYKALSETARSVADLANEFARRVAIRDASRQEMKRKKSAYDSERRTKGKGLERGDMSSEDEIDGDVPVKMMNSIYSDSSRNSEEYGYGFGTASTTLDKKAWPEEERQSVPPSPTTNKRGRDMTRTAGKVLALSSSRSPDNVGGKVEAPINETDDDQILPRITSAPLDDIAETPITYPSRPTNSRSTTRTNNSTRSTRSPATSKGASIVLLGLTALFGLQRKAAIKSTTSVDLVQNTSKAYLVPLWNSTPELPSKVEVTTRTTPIFFYSPHPATLHRQHLHHNPPPHPPTWERIIGRISAWTCTVLYMTSRLPQIWTNLSRKSVQGLSILLFISAALGNALYSTSVLINPLAIGDSRNDYLWESLPFLLGSGGTLIFDAIIVCQWLAWRGNAPVIEVAHHHHHHHHQSVSSTSLGFRGHSRMGRNESIRRQWTSLERQPLLE